MANTSGGISRVMMRVVVSMSIMVILASSVAITLAPSARAATINVSMDGNEFFPGDITIDVGDTVTWTNNDLVLHSATDDGGLWDTGSVSPGNSASITFTEGATYSYHCEFHAFMTGTITVGTPIPELSSPFALFGILLLTVSLIAVLRSRRK